MTEIRPIDAGLAPSSREVSTGRPAVGADGRRPGHGKGGVARLEAEVHGPHGPLASNRPHGRDGRPRRAAATAGSPAWAVRIIGLVAAGLVVCLILVLAAADWLAAVNPRLALLLRPGDTAALLQVAKRALADEDPALVEEAARQALRSDPSSAAALALLGRAAALRGDRDRADQLMSIAAGRSPRDLVAQAWEFDRDVRSGDFEQAANRLDTIFRGQSPQDWPVLTALLLGFLTNEAAGPDIARVLSTNPPWRSWLLNQMTEQAPAAEGLLQLYWLLQAGPTPPEPEELRPFLDRLIGEGRVDEAYYSWLQSLPEARLSTLEPLYNSKFQYGLSNLPFDWTIVPVRGTLSRVSGDSANRVLSVDFFGNRVAFRNISHLLVLPPGPYVFSGREMADGLANDRGLRWRIHCLDDRAGALGETRSLSGTVAWRDFAVDFTVPEGSCAAQNLVLELPYRVALDLEISGGVSYTGLEIARR